MKDDALVAARRVAQSLADAAHNRAEDDRSRAFSMVLLGLLLLLYGAIMFFAGRISVERAPERLTVIHRLA